jgi:hypothetical protein
VSVFTFTDALKPKSQIPCRNIALHGFCKFQGKGCEFYHPEPTSPATTVKKTETEQQVPLILKRPASADIVPTFQNLSISGPPRLAEHPQELEIQRPHSGMDLPTHSNGSILTSNNNSIWAPPHSAPPTPMVHHGNEMRKYCEEEY